jgi:hypothetical protein
MDRIMAEQVRRAARGTFIDPHRGQGAGVGALDGHTMVAAPSPLAAGARRPVRRAHALASPMANPRRWLE